MSRARDIIDVRNKSSEQQFKEWICAFDIHNIDEMMHLGRMASNDVTLYILTLCIDQVGVVMRQALSVWHHALDKETPQKLWNDADPKHPSIARALRIDPSDPNAFYALFPFRLGKVEEEYRILVAIDPPALLSGTWHHIDIETILAWNPKTNTCSIVGDASPQLVLPSEKSSNITGLLAGDDLTIFGDPFQYFRAWIERRAIYRENRLAANVGKWHHPLTEVPGDVPGALMIGDPLQIRWPPNLPKVLNCIGCDQKAVRSAIFRSANIPDVVDANLRAVA